MADILPFKRPKLSEKHRGNTLCRNGHHKWRIENSTDFDSQKGKLVTKYRCVRCGETRIKGQ